MVSFLSGPLKARPSPRRPIQTPPNGGELTDSGEAASHSGMAGTNAVSFFTRKTAGLATNYGKKSQERLFVSLTARHEDKWVKKTGTEIARSAGVFFAADNYVEEITGRHL